MYQEKVEEHKKVLNILSSIYEEKNIRYKDSFSKAFKKHGNAALSIRIDDKYNRFDSLISDGSLDNVGESLEDTLLDMANYAIMAVMELRSKVEIPVDGPQLGDYTKQELIEVIDYLELTAPKKATKDELIKYLICEATATEITDALISCFDDEDEEEEEVEENT